MAFNRVEWTGLGSDGDENDKDDDEVFGTLSSLFIVLSTKFVNSFMFA